jgi:hypothetical protein
LCWQTTLSRLCQAAREPFKDLEAVELKQMPLCLRASLAEVHRMDVKAGSDSSKDWADCKQRLLRLALSLSVNKQLPRDRAVAFLDDTQALGGILDFGIELKKAVIAAASASGRPRVPLQRGPTMLVCRH